MTPDGAKHLVVASVVVTGVLSSVHSVASEGKAPSVRIFVGLAFGGIVLAVLADSAPDLAGSFAALLLVSSIFTSGTKAFADISKGLSS